MLASAIPGKIVLPFANGAGGSYIRTVPVPSQIGITNGAASYTDGFPPLTFEPLASGGYAPDGKDFNGLLNAMSAWNRWQGAGGTVAYDSAFSTSVGGYPKGALLQSAVTNGKFFVSKIDNNTDNPDVSTTNWLVFDINSLGTPAASAAEMQAGSSNTVFATPKNVHDAGFPYISSSSLVENGGYIVWSNGFKQCWGTTTFSGSGSTTISLPVPHTTFINPMLDVTRTIQNPGFSIGGILTSGGAPTGFTVRCEDTTVGWWRTNGV